MLRRFLVPGARAAWSLLTASAALAEEVARVADRAERLSANRTVSVAEADLLRLAVGQPAMVRLAGSRMAVTGTIRLIMPTVDAQTRQGTVRIALADATEARAGAESS